MNSPVPAASSTRLHFPGLISQKDLVTLDGVGVIAGRRVHIDSAIAGQQCSGSSMQCDMQRRADIRTAHPL